MADERRGIERKLGHILVQVLLLENNGQVATQAMIKQELAQRTDAPAIKNMDHPLRYLLQGKDPQRTWMRPQTHKPWLMAQSRAISFVDRDYVLADYRACSGLLFAMTNQTYKGSYFAFSKTAFGKYLKDTFGVDNRLTKLFLDDFRKCSYTAQSEKDAEEQIFPDIVKREMFYIEVAANTNLLLKDYTRSRSV